MIFETARTARVTTQTGRIRVVLLKRIVMDDTNSSSKIRLKEPRPNGVFC